MTQEGIMEFQYQPVWKKITPELIQEIIAFWTAENALPKHEKPEARAQQAVVVMRDTEGKLAAVCTATVRITPRLRQPLYYYRTFCAKAYRGHHTVQPMVQQAKQTLLAYNQGLQPPEAIGLMLELESSQLVSQYVQAHHAATDFTFVGYSQREFPIFVHYFAGFNLQPPAALPRRPVQRRAAPVQGRASGKPSN
jgi:hypothetical protein